MNNLYFLIIIIGISAIVLIASIVVYQYQFAYGHHTIGDDQPEYPHNPSDYTFTFDDLEHCSEVQDAHESQYIFNLCKELGWSDDSGEWNNPYLDKEQDNTKDDDTYLDEDTTNNVITPPDSGAGTDNVITPPDSGAGTDNVITPPDSGAGTDNVENKFFSIKVPDNWAYKEFSNTIEGNQFGYGLLNQIVLTPGEFSETLVNTENDEMVSRAVQANFIQDTYDYRIKNAPLESYVKYLIDKFHISNITSQEYTTIDKEKAVRIYGNNAGQYGDNKILFYILMHDKEPYNIRYLGNPANFEKYLPEFEQIVKSFKLTDSQLTAIEKLENENITNTATNFSGANLSESELYTNSTDGDSNYPEELYDECVNVAEKSFCDSLFMR